MEIPPRPPKTTKNTPNVHHPVAPRNASPLGVFPRLGLACRGEHAAAPVGHRRRRFAGHRRVVGIVHIGRQRRGGRHAGHLGGRREECGADGFRRDDAKGKKGLKGLKSFFEARMTT